MVKFIKKVKYVVSSEYYGARVSGVSVVPALFSTAKWSVLLWNDPHHYKDFS
jgi:hypothetical protein